MEIDDSRLDPVDDTFAPLALPCDHGCRRPRKFCWSTFSAAWCRAMISGRNWDESFVSLNGIREASLWRSCVVLGWTLR